MKSPVVKNEAGSNVGATPVWIAGESVPLATGASLTAGTGTTPVPEIAGGTYIVSMVAGAWNGATIKVQYLGPDATTWLDAVKSDGTTTASLAANGTTGVVVGTNATLRLMATGGNPTGVYAAVS